MQKIKAIVRSCGVTVIVHQAKPGDKYFIDEDNNPYTVEELDFTVEEEKEKDDDFSITKIFGLHPIDQPKAPSFDEMNQSTLKLEKARKEMEKELLRLNFKCQLVTTFLSRVDSVEVSPALQDAIMNLVHYFEQEIFDKDDTD